MDFKKNGGFIELGGFGFILLGLFLNFIASSYGGNSLFEKPFVGWGVIFLLACLAGAAIATLSSVKPELLDKPTFKAGKYISDFGPAVLAYNMFIIAFALGVTFASADPSIHCGIGFYFIVLGTIEVIVISILRMVKFKTAPVQPVMQPMPGQPVPMQQPVMGGQPVMNQVPVQQPVQPAINPVQQPVPQQPFNPNQNR